MFKIILIRFMLPMIIFMGIGGAFAYFLWTKDVFNRAFGKRLGHERFEPTLHEESIMANDQSDSGDQMRLKCHYGRLYRYPFRMVIQGEICETLGHLRRMLMDDKMKPSNGWNSGFISCIVDDVRNLSIVGAREFPSCTTPESLADAFDHLATIVQSTAETSERATVPHGQCSTVTA